MGWSRRHTRRLIPAALAIVLAAPLAVFAYVGTFSRYMADDYCTAGALKSLGFGQSQFQTYWQWSGRFSFTAAISSLEMLGPAIARYLPGLLAFGLCLALYAALTLSLSQSGIRLSPISALSLALLVVFMTLQGSPNLYQSLYWQTGSVTYLVPVILAMASISVLLLAAREGSHGHKRRRFLTSLAAILVFLNGGFNEIVAVTQVVILASVLGSLKLLDRGRQTPAATSPFAVALLASILALVIVVLAPGNLVRASFYGASPGFGYWLRHTVLDTAHFLRASILDAPLLATSTALGAAALGALTPYWEAEDEPQSSMGTARFWRYIGLAVGLCIGLVMILMAVSQFAVASYPPERTLVMAQFSVALGIVLIPFVLGWSIGRTGGAVGSVIGQKLLPLILLLATIGLAYGSQRSVHESLLFVPQARNFAATWDQRDEQIREAVRQGERSLSARSLTSMGTLQELDYDPEFWVNQCVADYYGLDEITAK